MSPTDGLVVDQGVSWGIGQRAALTENNYETLRQMVAALEDFSSEANATANESGSAGRPAYVNLAKCVNELYDIVGLKSKYTEDRYTTETFKGLAVDFILTAIEYVLLDIPAAVRPPDLRTTVGGILKRRFQTS